MSYTTQARIETAIPAQHLVDALDDDGDGMADAGVLTEVLASAAGAVDAFLAGLFAVPFVVVPAVASEAAFVFACERIYDRRQVLEKNPWRDQAEGWRERLREIGSGKLPLDAALERSFAPGAVITENVAVDDTMR